MSVSREPAAAAASPRVTFEVERFAWLEGGRLEVVGRWFGIRGRRFLRPTLDVDVDGEPRRMLALLEHKPWAAGDGEEWIAAFEWTGEPAALDAAELAVGPELAVELPAPTGAPRAKRRARPARERLEARPPRTQTLEAELAAVRAETGELRNQLAAERRAREKLADEVRELRRERAAGQAAAAGLEEGRDAALAERDAALAERDAASAQRDAALAEREAAQAEAARAASERETALRERAALQHELTAAIRARDKARQERNEWLSRARAAADKDGPPGAKRPRAGAEAAPPPEAPPAKAAPAGREAESAPPPQPGAAPPDQGSAPTGPLPAAGRPRRLHRIPREAAKPLPPGGILMPPGPGAQTRRSIVASWGARLLVPLALVVLLLVVVLLIAWAF